MDKNKADEYLKVLASAYVWVASADKGVDMTEALKYEHVMMQSPFATQFEAGDIRRYFRDMVTLFADDFEAGIKVTKMRLNDIRGQGHLAQEVIRVCRAAAVGDGKLDDTEDIVLNEIAHALGIESNS